MALTMGSGPFSREPSGNFSVEPQLPTVFWEPFLPRVRLVLDGEEVVDTRHAFAVHASGSPMRICVPPGDVKAAHLRSSGERGDDLLGVLSLLKGEGPLWAGATVHSLPVLSEIKAPPTAVTALSGYYIVNFAAADAWYLDNDLGYAHPRDPYHRVDVHLSSRNVVVRLGGMIIAETDQPALLYETSLQTRIYLPPSAVKVRLLRKSETVSACPYKGDGQHWHLDVEGRRVEDAAWSLTTPLGDALTIPRWFSFYPEKVDVEVDGERLTGA